MNRLLPAALATLLLPLAASAAEDDSLVEVFAKGVGMTQDAAMKAANKAAVEQVVGTMVDTTTLVENDELVEDKILTYSAGLIADSKIVGEPKKSPDGLITVKVKATVKKTALKEKIAAAKLVSVEIDGESLWAQAISAQDNLAAAEAMIKDVLAKHLDCFVAEAIPGKNGKSPIDYDPKTGKAFANVRVRIDMAKYAQFANEVVMKLGPMSTRKEKVKGTNWDDWDEEYKSDGFIVFQVPKAFLDRNERIANSLLVMGSFRTGVGFFLRFDRNVAEAIASAMETGPVAVAIVLADTAGNEIAEKSRALVYEDNMTMLAVDKDRHSGAILPMFDLELKFRSTVGSGSFTSAEEARERLLDEGATKVEDFNTGLVEATYRISLGKLTPDELKKAGKLEIKVGHMKDGQFVE